MQIVLTWLKSIEIQIFVFEGPVWKIERHLVVKLSTVGLFGDALLDI